MTNIELKLKSIEYHAEVARSGHTYPAIVVQHANADLANTDIPYLLELVREQAAQIATTQQALREVRSVMKGWEQGELVNEGNGVVWREPLAQLPPRLENLKTVIKEALND